MICEQDKQVIRGDSDDFTITFQDSNGNPIDITGYTVWFTVRSSMPSTSVSDDSDAVISVKNTTHSAPLFGESLISVSPDDTNIDPRTYYYDIQYKKPDGSIHSTGHYKYVVVKDVTRGTS